MSIILIRGSSISAGHLVKKSYVDILYRDPAFSNDTIINISRFGDSSFQCVWQFDEVLSYNPHIIIIHFGMDDIYKPVYRSEFKENLVRIVQKAREASIRNIILTTLHLVRNEHHQEAVYIFTRTVREVALDLNCQLASVHLEWMNYLYETNSSLDALLTSDDRYPNETGHILIAQAIKKRLLGIESLQTNPQ